MFTITMEILSTTFGVNQSGLKGRFRVCSFNNENGFGLIEGFRRIFTITTEILRIGVRDFVLCVREVELPELLTFASSIFSDIGRQNDRVLTCSPKRIMSTPVICQHQSFAHSLMARFALVSGLYWK